MTTKKPQVTPGNPGRFTKENARVIGRKGTPAREARALDRLAETRQAMLARLPEVADGVLKVATGDEGNVRERLTAAFGVMDRVGLGPASKQEVTLAPSERLAQLLAEHDAS